MRFGEIPLICPNSKVSKVRKNDWILLLFFEILFFSNGKHRQGSPTVPNKPEDHVAWGMARLNPDAKLFGTQNIEKRGTHRPALYRKGGQQRTN